MSAVVSQHADRRSLDAWLERLSRLSGDQLAILAGELRRHAGDQPRGLPSARLVGYVVPHPGRRPCAAELRDFLAVRLPPPAVPPRFVCLDALPMLPSGKVDRRAIHNRAYERADARVAYVAARNLTEYKLARIWHDTLGGPAPGIHDSFWACGGDSLLAEQIVARMLTEFGAQLSASVLFEAPTIAELARRLSSAPAVAVPPSAGPRPVPREAGAPLSSAQLRHWFLQRMRPDSFAYNVYDALHVEGPLDRVVLERAVAEVARRHEIVRTRHVDSRGVPVQLVADVTVPVGFHDASDVQAARQRAVLAAWLAAQVSTPFDLDRPPLVRVGLLRFGVESHVLSVVAHHIVADDRAFNVLFDEVSALYAAYSAGRPSPLDPLAIQYGDYAMWERATTGETIDRDLEYWRRQFDGAPAPVSLSGRPGTPGASGRPAAVVPRRVTAATVRALTDLVRARDVTMFTVVLASFAAALGRRIGSSDVVIGAPFANRGQPELAGMMGCFINPMALRLIGADADPGALLDRAGQVIAQAYAHQQVPFERVVEAVRAERVTDVTDLFHVVLNFTESPRLPALPHAVVRRVPWSSLLPAKYELTLYVESSEEALDWRFVYDADRLSAHAVTELADAFGDVLDEMTHVGKGKR